MTHWLKRLRWRNIFALTIVMLIFSVVAQAAPTFYYVVTTVDTFGFESAYSNQATATFNPGCKCNVTLTWTAATVPTGGNPIAGYNVYRGTVSGGPYTKINSSLVTAGLTYTDPFVPPNATSGLAATTQ